MSLTISPTQDEAQIAIGTFLRSILPDVEVIEALDNRVPEPRAGRFVVIWPLRFTRLSTNLDRASDAAYTGSIAGTILTVSAMTIGTIVLGAPVNGAGVLRETYIGEQIDGTPGGIGTYNLTALEDQTIGPLLMASGAKTLQQGAQLTVQLDFHSADNTAADLAQIVSTVMRDEAAGESFAAQDTGYRVFPLHADDPKSLPFINENQQYEWRWTVEAQLQVNQITTIPQQYADVVSVEVVSVAATYAP